MKKNVIAALLVISIGLSFLSINTYQKSNNVSTLSSKIIDNDVLIKNENLDILYHGNVKNIPENLQNKQVIEFAACEDSENTITLFIK